MNENVELTKKVIKEPSLFRSLDKRDTEKMKEQIK
jgi:hypothetical protein